MEQGSENLNPSSSECDSNDTPQAKGNKITCAIQFPSFYLIYLNTDDGDVKEEGGGEDESSYFENETDVIDSEYMEEEGPNCSNDLKAPDYAIANVSCQYDGSPGTKDI